jgi:hypothetical protein
MWSKSRMWDKPKTENEGQVVYHGFETTDFADRRMLHACRPPNVSAVNGTRQLGMIFAPQGP